MGNTRVNVSQLFVIFRISLLLLARFIMTINDSVIRHVRVFQKCADYKASEIPTFARTDPPDTQVKSLFAAVRNPKCALSTKPFF